MNNRDRYLILRSKKIGLILADLRKKKSATISECAQAMGISEDQFNQYEAGDNCPSLPELEGLAYFLDSSVENLLGSELLKPPKNYLDMQIREKLTVIRNKKIAILLMAAREKAGLSYESLSSMTNIPSITLENYERCESPVPISDIELLSKALLVPLDALLDQNSVIGAWRKREELEGHVEALPDDLLQFMSQPVNRPFLELAKKLSDLSVERLRAVAEGLLEITY